MTGLWEEVSFSYEKVLGAVLGRLAGARKISGQFWPVMKELRSVLARDSGENLIRVGLF